MNQQKLNQIDVNLEKRIIHLKNKVAIGDLYSHLLANFFNSSQTMHIPCPLILNTLFGSELQFTAQLHATWQILPLDLVQNVRWLEK